MNRLIRTAAILAAVTLSALLVPVTNAAGQSADAFAFASGTVVHADLLRSGETRLVDVEVAFSGAVFDTGGLDTAVLNELDREFAPQLPDKSSFGRATGLEAGLGVAPGDENQVILSGRAEVAAPPNLDGVSNEIGPVDLDPLAWADLLRGEAFAQAGDPPCGPIGDISRGLSYVTDVQLLDTASSGEGDGLEAPVLALNASDPARAVSQSHSRTAFIAQTDADGRSLGDKLGVVSEVRETIAPVTLFGGTPSALTIEFLGEWVLRATATGMPGGAFVHYGPGEVSPETPVVRLIDADGVENLVTLQQLLGEDGLVVDVPGVAEIAIGEPPRAIDGAAGSQPTESADGTRASAAVDVVRVRALPGTPAELADIRVGHLEVSTQVPAGGVSCPAPEVEVRSAASLPKTGPAVAATLLTGLLLAAGALALRRRLS
ncbi:MAG TPA: hypothetical protein VFA34_07740 [Actinomycetota bacterium]|jgi:hypothetical protein|nr:hypothetical protein [Actinomycetota bacterium]